MCSYMPFTTRSARFFEVHTVDELTWSVGVVSRKSALHPVSISPPATTAMPHNFLYILFFINLVIDG